MPDKDGGVRKCLILGLRNTISSVLFLLMISLFSLDHSSMCVNSVARSTGEFSATSNVVSSAYCQDEKGSPDLLVNDEDCITTVSYTHLTLPTIYSV